MTFLPNGKSIITGGSNEVKVWDIISGQNTLRVRHTNEKVDVEDYPSGTLTHSPVGEVVASTDGIKNEKVYLWDSVTGDAIKTFDLSGLWVRALDFSPDGEILAVGGSTYDSIVGSSSQVDLLQLLEVESGEVIFSSSMNTRYVESIDFFPDGSALVFGASEQQTKILDMETKGVAHTFINTGHIQDTEISPNGNVLACSAWQWTIELWDVSWWTNRPPVKVLSKSKDVNNDGVVDIRDLIIVSSELNTSSGGTKGDINGDGIVDIRDLILVANAMVKPEN